MGVDLEQELIDDLTAELSVADETFNADMLTPKIKAAIREVKRARKYPSTYSDGMIEEDLYNYYSNIRNIALYDYNAIGAEFQTSNSEPNSTRNYQDRNSLFNGIVPICVVV